LIVSPNIIGHDATLSSPSSIAAAAVITAVTIVGVKIETITAATHFTDAQDIVITTFDDGFKFTTNSFDQSFGIVSVW